MQEMLDQQEGALPLEEGDAKQWIGDCDDLKFENKFEVPVMYSTAIPGFMFAIYIT
jgi:hypothetical protein